MLESESRDLRNHPEWRMYGKEAPQVRSELGLLLLARVIPGRIRRNTASRPSDWNAAFPHGVFTAPGRDLLRDEGFRGLDHSRGGVVKRFPSPPVVAVPFRNTRHLVGVDDKGRHKLQAVGARDTVVTARLGIEDAVGVPPHRIVEGDVIFMLANALLAAVLSKNILGVQVAPVAIAAHKAHRHAVRTNDHPDLALTEPGIAGLIVKPGDLRHVNVRLLGLDHAV